MPDSVPHADRRSAHSSDRYLCCTSSLRLSARIGLVRLSPMRSRRAARAFASRRVVVRRRRRLSAPPLEVVDSVSLGRSGSRRTRVPRPAPVVVLAGPAAVVSDNSSSAARIPSAGTRRFETPFYRNERKKNPARGLACSRPAPRAAVPGLPRVKISRRIDDTWLILPVVICLSQSLSHASVSSRHALERAKPRMAQEPDLILGTVILLGGDG